MTTTTVSTGAELATVDEPLFSQEEQAALAGFLAGYSGLTRDAYTSTCDVQRLVRAAGTAPVRSPTRRH
ncbi:MAG TPA: hypothetical protein VFG86_22805 [Chloroflexota bacterium]|jgi:hypothetical protein|nr:hypothetical protein [Chloroflexota bacterium]